VLHRELGEDRGDCRVVTRCGSDEAGKQEAHQLTCTFDAGLVALVHADHEGRERDAQRVQVPTSVVRLVEGGASPAALACWPFEQP